MLEKQFEKGALRDAVFSWPFDDETNDKALIY